MRGLERIRAVLAVALVGLGGCGDAAGPEGSAELRMVHMSPDAPALDVVVDDAVLADALTYRQRTEYVSVDVRPHVAVRAAGASTTLIGGDLSLAPDQPHTLIVLNRLAAVQALLLVDDPTPAGSNARVRIVHGAPSLGAVDIYVTAPDAVLADATPAITGMQFRAVSVYLTMAAGTQRLRATATGTTTVLLDANPFDPAAGSVQTLVLGEAVGGGLPFSGVLLPDG